LISWSKIGRFKGSRKSEVDSAASFEWLSHHAISQFVWEIVNNAQHHSNTQPQPSKSPFEREMPPKRPLAVSSSSRINIDDDDDDLQITAKVFPCLVTVDIETNRRRKGESHASGSEERGHTTKVIKYTHFHVRR